MMPLAAALAALFVLLALGGAEPAALAGLGRVTLAALGLGLVWDVAALLLRGRRGRVAPARVPPRDRRDGPTILVDGSNVMHWKDNAPSGQVVARVVQALEARGERPHVYFDANAGYKLGDRFMDARALGQVIGLPAARITVADSGTPADPLLLDHAARARLRIVTNDRFQDWRVQFPVAGTRGALVKGHCQDGTPILRL